LRGRAVEAQRYVAMLKALSIQIQPALKIDDVKRVLEALAATSSLVKRHQFDEGFDKTRYLNFTFGTEDLKALWAVIQSTIFDDPAFAEPMTQAAIIVCEGHDGWNDYLQLFHFDPPKQQSFAHRLFVLQNSSTDQSLLV
jgi:hypothetical protein